MPIFSLAAFISLFFVFLHSGSASGKTTQVSPSDPWCNTVNQAAPGDEIIFAPGSYTSPCWITAKGTAGSPILIRSQSQEASQRATFAYPGSTANVLEFRDAAAFLILRGFAFAPTQDAVDAIRIRQANDITIE